MSLEVEAVDAGIRRYERSKDGRERATLGPEMDLIVRNMDKLIPAIRDLQVRVANGEAMQGVTLWGAPLLSVSDKKLALLTLVEMVNESNTVCVAIAERIAERVKLERYYELLKSKETNAVTQAKRFAKRWDEKELLKLKRRVELVDKPWPKNKKMWVGTVLHELAMQYCDCFEFFKIRTARGFLAKAIRLKPDVLDALSRQHESLSFLRPLNLPMVVPPRKGETLWDHGYLMGEDKDSCKSPLLKMSFKNHSTVEGVEDLGIHADAAHILGQTQWTTNKTILEVQETIFRMNSGVAGMMGAEPDPLPPRPGPEATKEQWHNYKLKAVAVHDKNNKMVSQRESTLFDLSEAKRFGKYPCFYHPWECDNRGRMYPQNALSPQGSDRTRSLLKFNRGKPLGKDGYEWLSIHLSNSIGEDKSPFPDRVQYVHDMRDEICRWAEDPLEHTGWADTDSPFKTLAAATEWAQCVDDSDKDKFISHVRVEQDGSTNGLQHLSALARDPVGALATNLIPMDRPQDLYSQVLAEVNEKIKKDITTWRMAGAPNVESTPEEKWPATIALSSAYLQAAMNWEGLVTRKTVKRGTMTTPYSVTPQGIRDQLIQDGFCRDVPGSLYHNANYMRDCIIHGVGKVVTKANEVMEWLKTLVAIAFEEDKALYWTNPAGLRVDQNYVKPNTRQIITSVMKYKYRVHDMGERKLHKKKQCNSVSPNYIHSVDAAHMAGVIVQLWDEGVLDMGMIHDSYAVHACDVPLMRRVILENFVEIHKVPLLDVLYEEVNQQLESDIPPPPEYGDLDINVVLDSPYAFH